MEWRASINPVSQPKGRFTVYQDMCALYQSFLKLLIHILKHSCKSYMFQINILIYENQSSFLKNEIYLKHWMRRTMNAQPTHGLSPVLSSTWWRPPLACTRVHFSVRADTQRETCMHTAPSRVRPYHFPHASSPTLAHCEKHTIYHSFSAPSCSVLLPSLIFRASSILI